MQAFNLRQFKADRRLAKAENQLHYLADTISHYSDKAKLASQNFAEKSSKTVQAHPFQTAIGAGIFGFLAGFLSRGLFSSGIKSRTKRLF